MFEIIPGRYEVLEARDSEGSLGYMTEVYATEIEAGAFVTLTLGAGWYSRVRYEIPNFGLGVFEPSVDDLPMVGKGTQLVGKLTDLQ
jgi:hypothetical protein